MYVCIPSFRHIHRGIFHSCQEWLWDRKPEQKKVTSKDVHKYECLLCCSPRIPWKRGLHYQRQERGSSRRRPGTCSREQHSRHSGRPDKYKITKCPGSFHFQNVKAVFLKKSEILQPAHLAIQVGGMDILVITLKYSDVENIQTIWNDYLDHVLDDQNGWQTNKLMSATTNLENKHLRVDPSISVPRP